MKKILAIVLIVIAMATCLSACGNENWGFGNYTFTHAHITDGVESYCVKVNSWHYSDLGCEIHTPNGGIYLSKGSYHLYESAKTCPYC